MNQVELPITPLPQPLDLLIVPRWIIPVVPAGVVLEEHALAVHEGRIVALLPVAHCEDLQVRERCERPDHLLIPGLVNAHGHAAMTLLRGLADDLPLMTWLEQHIWPAERRHVNADFVATGTRLAIAEMLRGGTTCFADMYFYPAIAAQTAIDCGIRAQIAFPLLDHPIPGVPDCASGLQQGLQLHDELRHQSLVSLAFGPHAPYTVSDDNLLRIRTLADEVDLPIHMHVHESADEIAGSLQQYGERPLQRLQRLGLLGPRLQAVHMTQVDDSDLALLSRHDVQVVHCPQSNLKLASGFCPVQRLLQAGVNVALGTDGAASNNDLDLLDELRTAALLAKAVSGEPTALQAHKALHMATLAGACALGLEQQIGSLEPGKQADLTLIDLGDPLLQPVYDPLSHLLYSSNSRQVSDVWVAGRRRLSNGQLATDLLPADIHQQVANWAARIKKEDQPDES